MPGVWYGKDWYCKKLTGCICIGCLTLDKLIAAAGAHMHWIPTRLPLNFRLASIGSRLQAYWTSTRLPLDLS